MGTNFYWKEEGESPPTIKLCHGGSITIPSIGVDDPRIHIGKRSAAGKWCHDCDVSLCKGGRFAVHNSMSNWDDRCMGCGKHTSDVGFACSFTWAQDQEKVVKILLANQCKVVVVDEYGSEHTGQEFSKVLTSVKVEFYDSIGKEFF